MLPFLLCVAFGLAQEGATEPVGAISSAYRIGGGDTLAVTVYGEPTMSGNFPVDASGELDFPLLGRITVAGLSPTEVAALLRSRLSPGYLRNPNITVSVATYRSQPVQVLGAVAKPGLYYLRGPTTVMQIVSEAGGVARDGIDEVRVTHDGSTTPEIYSYEQLLRGTTDTTLVGGDIVFVPQSLVSVTGQVGKPGEVAFREGLTLSQCIASVGGALPTAALGHVYIYRGEERILVSVRKILDGKAPDVALQPGDRVYLPQSAF